MAKICARARPAGAEAFELRSARLAFGIDLAAVEGGALLGVAKNFVSRADFREPFFRPRLFALVGVVFLGELAKRRLDVGGAGGLRHPKNVIRIAHHEPILRDRLGKARPPMSP